MRVYEGLNTPPYDPHIFKGTKLEWYNWHRSPLLRLNSYRCNYVFHYDQIVEHYPDEPFYPDITCNDIRLGIFLEAVENGLIAVLEGLNSFNFDGLNMTVEDLLGIDVGIDQLGDLIEALGSILCESPFDGVNEALCIDLEEVFGDLELTDIEISDATTKDVVDAILGEGFELIEEINVNDPNLDLGAEMILFGSNQLLNNPGNSEIETAELTVFELLNILYYFICYGDDLEMKEKVFQNLADYPELLLFVTRPVNLVNRAYSGIIRKNFLDLPYYNDCMVVVLKDDKKAPVCYPPENRTVYCDGLEESGTLLLSNDRIHWTRADFAHFICDSADYIDPSCQFDTETDAASDIYTPYEFCFAAPWDGGIYGYYGGPIDDTYHDYSHYSDYDCGDDGWSLYEKAHDWRPIYCRVWLLLDQFDDPNEFPTNFEKFFGTPTYAENCPNVTIDSITSGDLDECGVGYLTRTWTIEDGCGNSTSCYQTIYVKPRSDFEVIFPEDAVIDCEDNDLSNVGEPIISDNECELVGVTYEDQVFEQNGVGCYKIARKWKIINWCTYNPDLHSRYPDIIVDDRIVASEDRNCVYRNLKDNGDGYMEYLQIIKVVDHVAPELNCEPALEACNYNEDCELDEVVVELGTATDNCTDDDAITYTYIVKPEGSTSSNDYIYGHGNILQNVLPFGVHTVLLIASDGCGNSDTCYIELTVKDCKNPTPYCHDGIATVIMPSSGEITVWARDLDAGSYDNCTDSTDLRFTFSAVHPDEDSLYVPGDKSSYQSFSCVDLPNGESQLIQVNIYVWDEEDNVDFCTVGLLIQDNSGDACGDISVVDQSDSRKVGKITSFKSNKRSNSQLDNNKPNIQGLAQSGQNGYDLLQNKPNPFQGETIIQFVVPKTTNANLRILDLTGKVLFEQNGDFSKGLHEWKLNGADLGIPSGILYYQFESDEFVATKRMILIE